VNSKVIEINTNYTGDILYNLGTKAELTFSFLSTNKMHFSS